MLNKVFNRYLGGTFYLIMSLWLFISCDVKDEPVIPEDSTPFLSSFAFLKIDNPSLASDFNCNILGKDTIIVFIPHAHTDSLVASFTGKYDEILVDNVKQVSGQTVNNFNTPITYILRNEAGEESFYTFFINGYNGLPIIELNSEQPIESRTEYVVGTIKIGNDPANGVLEQACKIKGRGNATWRSYPKKPYKIKLDNKESVFGFPANKDWVLLAEYCDKSFVRTAFMCEVSKAVGLEYTVNYQHVDLSLNGNYLGTYIVTDQVEKAKTRIKIDDDGYIIEDDGYFDYESLWFTTTLFGYNYTFKYPNADKGDIKQDDENYVFIKSFVDKVERAIKKIPEDCDTYKELVDIKSFAKWYIVAEVLGNWEPNLYYVLPSKTGKLKMYPMWDSEWSLGLASKGNDDNPWGWYYPPYKPEVEVPIWKNRKYFEFLFCDPEFVKVVKEEWNSFSSKISEVIDAIYKVKDRIKYSQLDNFVVWDILNKYVSVELITFENWEDEVDYAISFFERRANWLNSYSGVIE